MKITKRFIQKFLFIFFMGILISFYSNATVSDYSFSQTSGSYTAIVGGNILGDSLNDDISFSSINIGFTFYFNGRSYTQLGINSNGYIAFGNPTLQNSVTVISDATAGSANNVISALNYDLQGQNGAELSYSSSGSAPNRTFVVQWSGYKASGGSGDTLNFQIALEETTNTITITYGTCILNSTFTAQVGLRGNTNADFNNRFVSDLVPVHDWSASIAGTQNSSDCVIKNGFEPTTGQTYTWLPLVPASPTTMTFSNIGYTRITVRWIDNSNNEDSFLVYQSIDNINFTLSGAMISTTPGATGTQYSLAINGLLSDQLYYFNVVSLTNAPSSPLTGNQATLVGTLCGVYKIGPTGDYASLTAALSDLTNDGFSCSVLLELESNYVSTVETFPIVIPYYGCTAARTLTIRPETGATNRIIATSASKAIDLYGATWLTIDGRANGTGSTINLSLVDSSTSGNAIRFANDAQHNTLRYLNLRGAATGNSTNGVVRFFNGQTEAGNSNNTITHCDITMSNTSPQVLLYSNTSIGFNSNNTISDNNFYDWFVDANGNTAHNYGINLGSGNTGWTISDNSFYQTTPQVYANDPGFGAAINISGGLGNGFTINGNFIGGSAPNCSGTWDIDHTGSGSPQFNGININVGTTTPSEIQDNTIKNISLSTAASIGTVIFNGISVIGGYVNIGTTGANTIGSMSGSSSIITTASANGAQTVGINCSSPDSVNIVGNNIGGIFATDSVTGINTSLDGIRVTDGRVYINDNIIGGTVNNSLRNANGNSSGNSFVTGISISGNVSKSEITFNRIRHLTNQYSGTSLTGIARGISTLCGVNTISSNIIEALSNNSPQSGASVSASIQGISQQSTTPGQTISGNVIRLLSNKSTTSSVSVIGIYYRGSASGTNLIERNRIYGLGAPLDTSDVFVTGIEIDGGNNTVRNNMVSIGTDTLGNSYTDSHQYIGILKNDVGNNNFYHNSVNIAGGSVGTKYINTYAFRRTVTGIDTVLNNIFANTRSNSGVGGFHYSYALNDALTINSDKNVLFGDGNGHVTGLLNGVDQNSLFDWYSSSGLDSNSLAVDPEFVSTINLHINSSSASPLESNAITIPGLTNDFDGQVRPGPAGSSNGGAINPDIGADEFDEAPLTINMGPYGFVQPGLGCHTAADSVTVTIKNYGLNLINFATHACSIYVSTTGAIIQSLPVKIVNTGTLASGSSATVYVGTVDMTSIGTYAFHVVTTTSGDNFEGNDTLAPVLVNVFGGELSPSSTTICDGSSIAITLSGQTNGASVQWERSTDGAAWFPVFGSSTTLIVSPVVKTYYRAITCGINYSLRDTIDIASVAMPTTSDTTRCGPGPVTLHAAGASEIAWFDALTNGTFIDTGLALVQNVTQSGTIYAAAIGNVSADKEITTTFGQTLTSDGNMFTIRGVNNVTITGFDVHGVGGTNTWSVYYRKDNFLNVPGSNTSSNGWIFVDSVSNVPSAGVGVPTSVPFNMSVLVPEGDIYSFYVMVNNSDNVYTTVGTNLGDVNALNLDLEIGDGYSGTLFNCTGSPHVFNGIVHYKTLCLSNRVLTNYTVISAPSVSASPSPSSICEGDSSQLTVTSANVNYSYTWSPSGTLSSPTGNSVWAYPVADITYYLNAIDGITGCLNADTVQVAVTPVPVVNLGIDTIACATLLLDAGNPGDTYLWSDNSSSQTLTVTSSNNYYVTVTHLTCSATDTINVGINSLPVVFFTLPYDTVCRFGGAQVLSGGNPGSGTYSGTGVTGNNFDPGIAGTGTHVITYTYVAGTGCSNTATDSIFVDFCTSIKEISNDGLVGIYPNPTSNEITIDLRKLNETCKVELFSPEMKLVSAWELQGGAAYPESMGPYANGVYYLRVSTARSNYVMRVVKQE